MLTGRLLGGGGGEKKMRRKKIGRLFGLCKEKRQDPIYAGESISGV